VTRTAPRLFGTDGIRGPAGEGPLAPSEVRALGRALAAALRARRPAGAPPPRALLGRDTRPSGPALAAALSAGLRAGGVAVEDGGVLPTPAVALLVPRRDFDLGVAVSASHNPPGDNGIKLLGPDGEKVPESLERDVEARLPAARRARGAARPATAKGRGDHALEYADAVLREFRGLSLRGMTIVVDGADGAASGLAPAVLRLLGATVHAIRCGARGSRINVKCGALHPEAAGRAVLRRRARLGIALDGDADRLALVDERGRARDGDDLLAALAPRLGARGLLPGGAVVGTVMANGGLDRHLRRHGVALRRVPVGDRFVAAAMREEGLVLGAEPSGHVLLPRPGGLLTADGLVAALWVLREMADSGRPLSALVRGFARVPRAETAVRVARKTPLSRVPRMRDAIRAAERAAGASGRVLVRYSGTESKVRILVEAKSLAIARRACAALAAAAEESLR
jgi:phosphoglucosamine mutase